MADRNTGNTGETRPATRETPKAPGLERGRARAPGERERDRAPRTGPRDSQRGGVDRGTGVE